MFTGIIEEIGHVERFAKTRAGARLTVASRTLVRELKQGDSIAVSGVCLTAVDITKQSFTADLAPETLARTSLSRLAKGALVNLELPVKSGTRLGGHVVQGHVDAVAKLLALRPVEQGGDYWLEVEIPSDLARYVVHKGSIAIEGISLTVAKVEGAKVSCAIIPHSFEATNLKSLAADDPVNVEVDVLAKYAEKMFQGEAAPSEITLERLVGEGF
jgi:riboflavin synthase